MNQPIAQQILSLLDLNNYAFSIHNAWCGNDQKSRKLLPNDRAKLNKALDNIWGIDIDEGKISVSENNFDFVWEILQGIHVAHPHMNCDPYGSKTIGDACYAIYKFLSICKWTGPTVERCQARNSLICYLGYDEIKYYLWWREECRVNNIHRCGEYFFEIYVYDLLLNTAIPTPVQTLAALRELYSRCGQLCDYTGYDETIRLGFLISNYSLFNGLWPEIEKNIKSYGVENNYSICKKISNGYYDGCQDYLMDLVFRNVRTPAFLKSTMYEKVLASIPYAMNAIHPICKKNNIDIALYLVGKENPHFLWHPYGDPRWETVTPVTVPSHIHSSFSIGLNEYYYVQKETRCIKPAVNDIAESQLYNDNGILLERSGQYYCKHFDGADFTGKLLMSSLVRMLQNHYLQLQGKKKRRELRFPFPNIQKEVEAVIGTLPICAEPPLGFVPQFKLAKNQANEGSTNFIYAYSDLECKSMNDQSRILKLEKTFELLKDASEDAFEQEYFPDFYTIAEKVIIPMLSLDIDKGQQMWEYMLDKYYNICPAHWFSIFTDHIIDHGEHNVLLNVFIQNQKIREYVFLLDKEENHLAAYWFIRDLVYDKNLRTAGQLLALLLRNNHGDSKPQANLFETLNSILSNSDAKWKMDLESVKFIEEWIPYLTNGKQRSIIELALDDVQAAVEGNAPKGSMSLNLFLEKVEDGTAFSDLIAENKKTDSSSSTTAGSQKVAQGVSSPETIDESLKSLRELVGLKGIKEDVETLTNLIKVRLIREKRGLKNPDMSLHLVFSGNPGTGKTTVARILANIYHSLGVLSKGHLVEVDRCGLVGGYVGQTAIKTQEVIERALGGILFIDEAYALAPDDTPNDYGSEAINTILKAMEDHRDDLIVIVAGYSSLMPKFIDSNPGLKSRFNKYLLFTDYTGEELYQIFKSLLAKNDYWATEKTLDIMKSHFHALYENRGENFGNARDVRNLFEKIISNQANRIASTLNIDNLDISSIIEEDLIGVLNNDA